MLRCNRCHESFEDHQVVYPCCCDATTCITCHKNNAESIVKSICPGCLKTPKDARAARAFLKHITVRSVIDNSAIAIDPGRALIAERNESLKQIFESLEAIKEGMRNPEILRIALATHREWKNEMDSWTHHTHKPFRDYDFDPGSVKQTDHIDITESDDSNCYIENSDF